LIRQPASSIISVYKLFHLLFQIISGHTVTHIPQQKRKKTKKRGTIKRSVKREDRAETSVTNGPDHVVLQLPVERFILSRILALLILSVFLFTA